MDQDEDIVALQHRIAMLEAQIKKPSLWKKNLLGIAQVAGWILMVPGTIAAALAGLAIPLTFILALLGVVPWHAPIQWIVIALVLALIRFIGAALIAWGRSD